MGRRFACDRCTAATSTIDQVGARCLHKRDVSPTVAFSSFLTRASEPVILSAAGAKDLLFHRCEGAAFRRCEGAAFRCEGPAFREGRPQAGPSLRARSARFAQDDMPAALFMKKGGPSAPDGARYMSCVTKRMRASRCAIFATATPSRAAKSKEAPSTTTTGHGCGSGGVRWRMTTSRLGGDGWGVVNAMQLGGLPVTVHTLSCSVAANGFSAMLRLSPYVG